MIEDPIMMNAFPATNHLIQLGQLLPSSTASVERIFSLMNSLCTPQRNRLSQNVLDALMRICSISGEELSMEQIQKIVLKFKNMKSRDILL